MSESSPLLCSEHTAVVVACQQGQRQMLTEWDQKVSAGVR